MEHELEAGQTHSIEDYFADFISLAPDEPPQIHSHSDGDQSVKTNLLECDSGNKTTVHDDKEHPTREEPQLQEYFNNPLLMPAANLFPTPILQQYQQHQQHQQHHQHQHSQPVPNSMDIFQNYMHQLSAIAAAATAAAEATGSKNLSYVTPFSHQNMALYNALFPVLSQPAHDQAISSLTFKLDDNSGRNEPLERTSQSVQQVQQSIQQQQQQHLQQSIQQQQHLQQSIQQLMPSIQQQQQQLPLPIQHIPLTAQHQLQLPMQHIQSIQQLQLPSSSTATTTTLLSNQQQQQQQQQQLISDALIQAMNISPRTPNIMGTPIQAAFSLSLNTIGTEPVVLIRGARKSIFGNLASLKELNSVPYKYCVKVCLPYARNAKFKDMSYEQLQFALVCIDPDNAQPEYPIEEGIMVEKHMKTKKTELCIEIELKVYLNAYSHGYNQNAFVVELYDARTRERLLRTQHIWVYARRAKKRGRDDLDSHNLFED